MTDFKFYAPLTTFYKADAPKGRERRIAGIISTDNVDREGERVIQQGLDFADFLSFGCYNLNHERSPTGMLGYPESTKRIRKGEKLPNGDIAKADSTWSEGYLVQGYKPADDIWALGQALEKGEHARRLGFSIEGAILKRSGPDNKTIAKANVRNVAITHCPVNADTYMTTLAKALSDVEDEEQADMTGRADEEEEKALSAGNAYAPMGPQTGAGAGRVLTPQSLEGASVKPEKPKAKKLNKSQAIDWIRERYPSFDKDTAERVVNATISLRTFGIL